MTVYTAKSAGFCFGVDRAVSMTREALEKGKAWSLGELIHNRDVVDMLAAQGLSVAERVEDIPDGARLVIRSHGVSRRER